MKRLLFIILLIAFATSSNAQGQEDTLSYETQTVWELLYGNLTDAEVTAQKFLKSIPKEEISERMVKANRYLGNVYARQGKIEISRIYYLRALKKAKLLSPRNKDLEDGIESQLAILNSYGKDAVPELKYDKSKVDSGELPLTTCFNLVQNGKYAEAIPSLLKWKGKLESLKNRPNEQYYALIICLGNAYASLGRNDQAFNLYMNVLEGEKGRNDLQDPELRNILSSMGTCYIELKNYTQAIVYFMHAKMLFEQVRDYGMGYIRVLENMALSFTSLQWNFRAKMCIDEAALMYEESIGKLEEGQIDGLNILNTQAMINQAIGKTDEAIMEYQKITGNPKNREKSQGIYQLALNNLAICYTNSGRYAEAVDCFSQLHSENSEQEYVFQQNVAFAACMANQSQKSVDALQNFNMLGRENCAKVFANFSERERESYWTSISADMTILNNAIAGKMNSAIPTAYDNAIFTKNMLLTASNVLRKEVESSGDASVLKEYLSIQAKKDSLMYVTMSQEQKDACMQDIIIRERHLIQTLPNFASSIFSKFGTWKDVQAGLNDDEAAIEFIMLPQTGNIGNQSTWYAALVLRKGDSSPTLIELCPRYKLKSRLQEIEEGSSTSITRLYTEQSDSSLYNLVWAKLDKELQNINKVYFSPTGDLNSINYNAIKDDKGRLLSTKYGLCRLSSTAKIDEIKSHGSVRYSSAIVYGGILYSESEEDMAIEAKNYKSSTLDNNLLAQRSEDERGGWKLLRGTIAESSEISETLNSNNVHSDLLQFGHANEESLKAYSHNSPDIIHIATHGFFIENEDDLEKNAFLSHLGSYTSKDNNLLYTGLLMAGANNAWKCKTITKSEDGILTADEISRLDFSNTKLVVLSACQTGKGHIDPIDGVFGLQRGFKKAGAGTIVMSLWKVPDEATSTLMKHFYKNLIEGMDSRTALLKATEVVREQHPDPYYWAAFVVLD